MHSFKACQVELKDTNGLFFKAHQLVDSYPEKPVSWFAVGCYYYLIGNNENARRYFGKASRLDLNFGPAWLGFGHSFALEGYVQEREETQICSPVHQPGT